MAAIYISCSSRDQQVANDVIATLKRLRIEDVFLSVDKHTGTGVGADWERGLYEQLSRCHALIPVLTSNWLASTWCRVELAKARALGKVILPVLCAPLGDQHALPEIEALDMLDWSNPAGATRLEERLRAITNELARGFPFDSTRPPYPGLLAFEAEDAAIHFGRDDETRAVIERLEGRRAQGGPGFHVVIGAAGSGKSSLLKAGVLPQLSRRRRDWVVLPPIRPESAPVEALAKAIAQQLGKPTQWRTGHQALSGAAAINYVEELLKELRVGEARAATVLLPVDQFDEVFTIATAAERAIFLHLLASALDPARHLPMMVVATGQSDALERLLEAGDFAHFTEIYPLPPMPPDRVPRLVEGPAAVAGLSVEKGLIEAIVSDADASAALPRLGYTLWLLNRRSPQGKLSLGEYRLLGDLERGLNPIQNAVRLVADLALGGLRPSDAELRMRDAFVPHLVRVRLENGERVRQCALVSELPADSRHLIEALVEARLLTSRGKGDRQQAAGGSDACVEVAHEALFKAWPALDQWLTVEHAFLSDIERITSAHDIWVRASEDQKARALLSGLLLSRARDWLLKYPQRFLSRDKPILRAFIDASAQAEDAEMVRIAAEETKNRRAERRRFQAAIVAAIIFFCASTFAGWQYFAAKQAQFAIERAKQEMVAERDRAQAQRLRALAEVVTAVRLRGDLEAALRLGVHAVRLDHREEQAGTDSPARAALAIAVSQSSPLLRLNGHEGAVWYAAFSPAGSRVVTASQDKTARIWDAVTGNEVLVLRGHADRVNFAAFSPDGSRIVTTSSDTTARVWDTATGKAIAVLRGDVWQVCAAFSSDGTRIVTTSSDNAERTWDIATGKEVARKGIGQSCTALSPDGSRVVTPSSDNTARIRDVGTGKEIAALRGHDSVVNAANFSSDGTRIVTASDDNTARVWDAATANEIAVLRGHEDRVNSAAFSSSGSRIVTASSDKTARIWEIRFDTMSTKDLLVGACTRRLRGLGRLSRDEMRLAGYADDTPEIDVCAGIE